MNLKIIYFVTITFIFSSIVYAKKEKHSLRVKAFVEYRCYKGSQNKKVINTGTNIECDNKTYEKVLFDQNIFLVFEEADEVPDEKGEVSGDMYGSFFKEFLFRGRQYYAVVNAAIRNKTKLFNLTIRAYDFAPVPRSMEVNLTLNSLTNFHPFVVHYDSRSDGRNNYQPFMEEIRYKIKISPPSKTK